MQATAAPDEMLVTRTVADLVAGSGISRPRRARTQRHPRPLAAARDCRVTLAR
jgi:hypothetical protein